MRTKNLSRAGEQLGLSQPAMSHALERLRRDFQDPLFVRAPGGVVPTPQAERLCPAVEALLEQARLLYRMDSDFDPQTISARLTLATTDYFEQAVLPKLLAKLTRLAPNLTLVCRPLTGTLPKEGLENGTLDLAIAGYFSQIPDGYFTAKLFDERFVCLARRGHPKIKGRLTLKEYISLKHAIITLQGDLKGRADTELEKLGEKREIAIAVSNFLSSGWVVAESDLLLTAPSRLAERLCQYLPLQSFSPPLKLSGFTVIQVWHQRTHREPLNQWFRHLLQQVCTDN